MNDKESKLRQAFSIGCTVDEALCYAEMRKTEWLEFLSKNAGFLHELGQMRLKPLVKARFAAVKALDNPRDAQWYLERKASEEFGAKSKHEVTGKDGAPLAEVSLTVFDRRAIGIRDEFEERLREEMIGGGKAGKVFGGGLSDSDMAGREKMGRKTKPSQ